MTPDELRAVLTQAFDEAAVRALMLAAWNDDDTADVGAALGRRIVEIAVAALERAAIKETGR